MGIAYIVSILASLVVSLTVTPVLSYWMLPKAKVMGHDKDSFVLRWLKWLVGYAIRFSVRHPWPVLGVCHGGRRRQSPGRVAAWPRFPAAVQRRKCADQRRAAAGQLLGDLQPAWQAWSNNACKNLPGVVAFGRRTGRAELDEHAEGVNMSEIIVSFDPHIRPQPRAKSWTTSARS